MNLQEQTNRIKQMMGLIKESKSDYRGKNRIILKIGRAHV